MELNLTFQKCYYNLINNDLNVICKYLRITNKNSIINNEIDTFLYLVGIIVFKNLIVLKTTKIIVIHKNY